MLSNSDMNKLEKDFMELPKIVQKNELKEWIIMKQFTNRTYCNQASISEIVKAAEKCGITVNS